MEGYVPKQNPNTGGGNGNGPGNTGGNTSGPNPQAADRQSVAETDETVQTMRIEIEEHQPDAPASEQEVEETRKRSLSAEMEQPKHKQPKDQDKDQATNFGLEELRLVIESRVEVFALDADDNDTASPQPDERITQAEYEKVVKGARLTDPVEEPISRSCTDWICCVTLLGDKPVYMCAQQIHTVDDNYKESVLVDCNNHFTQTESSEAHLTLSVSVM